MGAIDDFIVNIGKVLNVINLVSSERENSLQ